MIGIGFKASALAMIVAMLAVFVAKARDAAIEHVLLERAQQIVLDAGLQEATRRGPEGTWRHDTIWVITPDCPDPHAILTFDLSLDIEPILALNAIQHYAPAFYYASKRWDDQRKTSMVLAMFWERTKRAVGQSEFLVDRKALAVSAPPDCAPLALDFSPSWRIDMQGSS